VSGCSGPKTRRLICRVWLSSASAYAYLPSSWLRTALDRAAARIEGKFANQPQVQAAIRSTIGRTYYELGLFPEATMQLEKALDLQRRVSGPENPETLGIMNNLGNLYDDEGKYAEAEALDNLALESSAACLVPRIATR